MRLWRKSARSRGGGKAQDIAASGGKFPYHAKVTSRRQARIFVSLCDCVAKGIGQFTNMWYNDLIGKLEFVGEAL